MKPTPSPRVHLRCRQLKNGNQSLYLDYSCGGRRSYQTLNIHLVKPTCQAHIERNDSELARAQKLRKQLETSLATDGFTSRTGNNSQKTVLQYCRGIATEKRKSLSASTLYIWQSALHWLGKSGLGDTYINKVNALWMRRLIDYWRSTTLSVNSQAQYLCKIRCCLRKAAAEGHIQINVLSSENNIAPKPTLRTYLTLKELRRLSLTPCRCETVKRIFLLGCYTGLRISDLSSLRWSDLTETAHGISVTLRQRKTGDIVHIPLKPQATKLLISRQGGNGLLFPDFKYRAKALTDLNEWCQRARVGKHIGFHTARHTFAIALLENGVDIYSVQSLLGHRDIASTQIYARVTDKMRRRAIDLLPDF